MKKLIWQYNVKTTREYDKGFQEIARLSIDTVKRYANKIGADHFVESRPTLFDENKNFPAIDFLVFLKNDAYTNYDYIIKFDADFLIGPTFPDLSSMKAGYVGLAGYHFDEEKDRWRNIHERTWRHFELDLEKWKKNYCIGGMAGFPRSTKKWLMENIEDSEIDLLSTCKNTVMVHEEWDFKWSIVEQSYINYLLYHAPFKVKALAYPLKSKKLVYHHGPRVPGQIVRYKKLHTYFMELWDAVE